MSGRDGLAEVLTPLVARIAVCDYHPDHTTACLSCSDDARHLAAAVRAYLTSDEVVERVAFGIFAEHEPAFAHQEERTRLWHVLLNQFRDDARAALAAATEADR